MAVSEAQKRANKNHRKKLVQKVVTFNVETEADLIKKLEHIENFSSFVKEKIAKEKFDADNILE